VVINVIVTAAAALACVALLGLVARIQVKDRHR